MSMREIGSRVPKGARRIRRTAIVGLAVVVAATLGTLAPGPALAQADLAVVSFSITPPSGQPGGVIYVNFAVRNVGFAPTLRTAITNYLFIWDPLFNSPVTQLLPCAAGHVHTLRPLLPGETDVFTSIPVTLPATIPMDTTFVLALVTDYVNLELESNEGNNMALAILMIEPLVVPFTPMQYSVVGAIDSSYWSDVYRFPANAGDIVYAEAIATELGSMLDAEVMLLGPHPDSLLTPEGAIEEIAPDSRLTCLGIPGLNEYRLDVSGEGGSVGMYELRLQRGYPESEPNDDPSLAGAISYGEVHAGEISFPGDVDWYSFNAGVGDIIVIDVDAGEAFAPPPGSIIDLLGVVVAPAGDTFRFSDDENDVDPHFYFVAPVSGTYHFGLEGSPGRGLGGGYPGCAYVFKMRQVTGVQLPDLVAGSCSVDPSPVPAGDTTQVSFETRNIGGLATFQGGVTIDIVLSLDAVVDPSDVLLAVGDFVGDLPPAGGAQASIVDVPIPPETAPGNYFLGIALDVTSDEVESDETNNTVFLPIVIDPATGASEHATPPSRIALLGCYPNPFSRGTVISYELPAASQNVEIAVYDVAGRRVATLVNGIKQSGRHQLGWDGRAGGRLLPSGVYFCKMKVGSAERSLRIVLVR
jgi:hypothetical protein